MRCALLSVTVVKLAVDPLAELAPRDIVARAVYAEATSDRGAFLDCRQSVGAAFKDKFLACFWELEEHLAELVDLAGQLANPVAMVVLSTYAVGYSPLAFINLFGDLDGGSVEAGELAIPEAPGEEPGGPARRWLPAGFCARWARGCAHDVANPRGA